MGKRRSDASGIARVFFNWAQMVSMLQSVKLQPPEEVTNAMETAEVLNVSVEWWPVQCTLRLTFLSRAAIYMAMPIFAVVVPLVYVYVMNKCDPVIRLALARHRSVLRTGKKLKGWAKLAFAVVSALSGEEMVKKANKTREMRVANRHADEVTDLHEEIDLLIDEVEAAEVELTELKRVRAAEAIAMRTGGGIAEKTAHGDGPFSGARDEGTALPRLPPPAFPDAGAESLAEPLTDLVDSLLGDHVQTMRGSVFFTVTSTTPIALRAVPSRDGAKLGVIVRHNDVLRSELIKVTASCRFIKLAGPWGEGWLFDRLADGALLLREVDADTVINTQDPVEAYHREEIVHLFRTLCAIADTQYTDDTVGASCEEPSVPLDAVSIAKETIEYLLPSKMTEAETNAFFAGYDEDGDGTISFGEFVVLYPVLRETWRLESVWEEFQHMDDSRDGRLQESELHLLVPQGSSRTELNDWMMRYDSGGKGYLTIADFVAIHAAVKRDRLMLAIGTSFVLCTYFVYSRVTKALLSVFSVETVEGVAYLKMEMGTLANTPEHILMMGASGLYILGFTVAVPLIGLYIMFQVRHKQDERRVGTMAGFLMDGYRPSVAWYWEFIVLGRKLVILSVSLFVAEPFLQSFVAIIVLIASLSIQLLVQPFELAALNLLEVFALSGLLATQLSGTLMWYKNQPGHNEHMDVYRVYVVTSCEANVLRSLASASVRLLSLLCSATHFVFRPFPLSIACAAPLTCADGVVA
jgi:Ca2+-binding EF-hand superfamily protein